ncbi:unnamed protein product [Rhodiola kirilowii]
MIISNAYNGITGNAHHHLDEFKDFCATYKPTNVDLETIYLRLFHLSLKDRAKEWLKNHPPNTFTTWDQLSSAFLMQFFPPAKTKELREAISKFTQKMCEDFHEAYERFKRLLWECPHHGNSPWQLLYFFYNGMDKEARHLMDNSGKGAINKLPPTEAFQLIEELAANSLQFGSGRNNYPKDRDFISGAVATKDDIQRLTTMFEAMMKNQNPSVAQIGMEYSNQYTVPPPPAVLPQQPVPLPPMPMHAEEDVNFVRNQPYNNNSRPAYEANRNYQRQPYFNYQNNHQSNQMPQTNYAAPAPKPWNANPVAPTVPKPQNTHPATQEQMMQHQQQSQQESKLILQKLNELQKHNAILENQIAQQASASRYQSQLPPQADVNQTENINAVTLRNGKELQAAKQCRANDRMPELNAMATECVPEQNPRMTGRLPEQNLRMHSRTSEPSSDTLDQATEPSSRADTGADNGPTGQPFQTSQRPADSLSNKNFANLFEPLQKQDAEIEVDKRKQELKEKVPFPQRLKKRNDNSHIQRFAKLLSNLQLSMPFTDIILQMPGYGKFLKDIVTNKKKLDTNHVTLDANCSAIIQHVMPKKLNDFGAFCIPITIGPVNVSNALCDLGASISLMPFSLYKKLDVGELTPTPISLRLADTSSRLPKGILEDMLIKIGELWVHVDFYVLEMDVENETPIILGRPFLNTVQAVIDCGNGTIEMNLGIDKVNFFLKSMMKAPRDSLDCAWLDTYDDSNHFDELPNFEHELLSSDKEAGALMMLTECEAIEEAIENKDNEDNESGNEFDENLKPLPSNLRYEFLGPNSTLPVIVDASLNKQQTVELLNVLRKYKSAIGHSIDDIKGISPSICMHRIHLEDDAKPSSEHLRRLNPNLNEVVFKEIAKLCDAGIIYSVVDLEWVSPIHVVPKKGGLTVVTNNK